MTRSAAVKILYLFSAVGTLALLGCSGTDGETENSDPVGRGGSSSARAGATGATPSAGSSSAGRTSTAGAAAGGAAGAAAGGAPSAGASPSSAGTGGRDIIGFGGFAGLGGSAGVSSVIRIDGNAGFGGTSIDLPPFPGQGGGLPWDLADNGGSGFWISP